MKCNTCDAEMIEEPRITFPLTGKITFPFTGKSYRCPNLEVPEHIKAAAKGISIMDQNVDTKARQVYKGGAAATKVPGFKYIPLCALERLAKRFELGLERHKEHSWNPLNPRSAVMLDDKEWLIERLSHVIHHAYKEIERLNNDSQPTDDNAAAIMWGGACLIAADERRALNAGRVAKDNPEKRDI